MVLLYELAVTLASLAKAINFKNRNRFSVGSYLISGFVCIYISVCNVSR